MINQSCLPTDEAQEPEEAARQQLVPESLTQKGNFGVTFAENAASMETSGSQESSVSYKEALSQPAPGLSHRQRLMWLQKRRSSGLWVRCDDCDKWRYLAHVLDRYELPKKWYCRMNNDKSAADCSVLETPMTVRDEEDFIHGEYAAGSLVWARMNGWPWWPAMVDDCPDTEQFYWLDGFSDIPTHYNVVFFDINNVTRAWIDPNNLKPYSSNKILMKTHLTPRNKYNTRINAAITQADDAERLPLHNRLAKYSFIARYKGQIVTPKKFDKEQLRKIKKRIMRAYNVGSDTDSSSDSIVRTPSSRNKLRNVHTLGTRDKRVEEGVRKARKDLFTNFTDTNKTIAESTVNEFKEPDSTSAKAETIERLTKDNSISVNPDMETVLNGCFTITVATPSSDDFEF